MACLVTGMVVFKEGEENPMSRRSKFRRHFHSIYDEKPVTVLVEFRRVADGPSYPARSTLLYPDKEIELIIENHDYERVSP